MSWLTRARFAAAQSLADGFWEGTGDLLATLLRGRVIGSRVRHGSSPDGGHTSGVYLPGDGLMCRDAHPNTAGRQTSWAWRPE